MARVSGVPNAAVDLERWDERVYFRLYELGFFRLLGLTEKPGHPNAIPEPLGNDHLVITPIQRGDDADFRAAGEVLERLFTDVGGDPALRVQLLGAVIDAIENVRAHAYKDLSPYLRRMIPPLWWLSGTADRTNRRLTLSIYDQGVSIPVTLPNTWSVDILIRVFRSKFGLAFDPSDSDHDGEALSAAMQLSATSTKQTQRGKGLFKIREVVATCNGSLRVISRRGNYLYHGGVERFSTTIAPLLGTYIELEATF